MKRILLNTYSPNEFIDACSYALVTLDDSLCKLILDRAEKYKQARAADSDNTALQKMVFYNAECLFMDSLPDYLEDFAPTDEYTVLPDDIPVVDRNETGNPDYPYARTECDRMIIGPLDMYWTCYPKHMDYQVETRPIGYELIEEVLAANVQ